MLDIFRKYNKRRDGLVWTKNTLLLRMLQEIEATTITTSKKANEWQINTQSNLFIIFDSSNYPEKNEVSLIASVYFRLEKSLTWESLDGICRGYYGRKYRSLKIKKDQEFQGSQLRKECQEVYRPLFALLGDNEKLASMIRGEEFELNGKKIKLRKVDHILTERGYSAKD